jgi:glutathione synthase/RimK-type ligase-like ATP-grasp enzyme
MDKASVILIITHKEDYTADFIISILNDRKINYFRFNCEDYLSYDIRTTYGENVEISINGLSKFSAIWYRRTKLPDIVADNESERIYLLGEIDTFMNNLFSVMDSKWLSHPFFVNVAENKLLQLIIAKRVGMNIPETITTTNIGALRQFCKRYNNTVIKPLGSGRVQYQDNSSKLIFTNQLTSTFVDNADKYVLTPAIYQEMIHKDYELRVTIVGEEVFAARIDSQSDESTKLDWRRSPKKFSPYLLSNDLKTKCIKVLKELNISFGAFDFIRGDDGEYYFLEVNPNGQWVWIEKDTGLLISEAIIRFLQ